MVVVMVVVMVGQAHAAETVDVPLLKLTATYAVDVNDYKSWIVKSICVDDSTRLIVPWDPYTPCPTGSSMRKSAVR
jgi:hypothetical protein